MAVVDKAEAVTTAGEMMTGMLLALMEEQSTFTLLISLIMTNGLTYQRKLASNLFNYAGNTGIERGPEIGMTMTKVIGQG